MRAIAGIPHFLAALLLSLAAGSARADGAPDPDEARIARMSLLDVALNQAPGFTSKLRVVTKAMAHCVSWPPRTTNTSA